MVQVPSFGDYIEPIWRILKKEGSASLENLRNLVAEDLRLTDEQLAVLHNEGPRTEFQYRMQWALTYLKQRGFSDNPRRGIWANTLEGNQQESIDSKEIEAFVRGNHPATKKKEHDKKENIAVESSEDGDQVHEDEEQWMDQLIATILTMSPIGFEKLCKRLLLEVGFEDVKVTQTSHDGGIDGNGKLRTMDLFTQEVAFQSKRYKPGNNIGSREVNAFRGAIDGIAKMGVIITTSSFTKSAEKAANRAGGATINLLDGQELCKLLKKYNIGVQTKNVEQIEISTEFFKGLE